MPPAGTVSISRASIDDELALRAALYEAVCWRETLSRPPIEEVLSQPAVEVYVESWGRPGDLGFVAKDASGQVGGAAWFRLFTPDPHGYGFVSQRVPEVSIGLERSWRGVGLGRRLLEHLHAAAMGDGIPRLSLAVNASNVRAVRLYENFGYVPQDIVGTSPAMEVQLPPRDNHAWGCVTRDTAEAAHPLPQALVNRSAMRSNGEPQPPPRKRSRPM